MRPWLSGIMSPCQGLVESSILSGRTQKKDPFGSFFESTTTKYPPAHVMNMEQAVQANSIWTPRLPYPQSKVMSATQNPICGQLRGQVDKRQATFMPVFYDLAKNKGFSETSLLNKCFT